MAKSIIKIHGGKAYLASKIAALIPAHKHYIEPFAGGLSVMLASGTEGRSEIVNDLDGHVSNFWSVLADPNLFEEFRRLCEATPFSERAYHEALEFLDSKRISLAKRAWAFFVASRQSLAGRRDGFATLTKSRIRRGMNEQTSAWLTAVDGLPEVHKRMRRVVVLDRDALDVIRQQDHPDAFFYCDPPYVHSTRAGTGEYDHEMTDEQHLQLLIALNSIKGKFILSGYPSKLYDDFADKSGWHRFDFVVPNQAAGGKEKRRMTERVWANFPLKEKGGK